MQLTQKEMMYLKDAKSQEELCIAKYTNYSPVSYTHLLMANIIN